MKVHTRSLVVLVSSLLLQACGSMNRAESSRMLDQRAGYSSGGSENVENPGRNVSLKEGGVDGFKNSPVPVRTRPKVSAIWIHPHETATRDYFWGGWISVVVESDQWVLSKPELVPNAPAFEPLPFRKTSSGVPLMPTPWEKKAN